MQSEWVTSSTELRGTRKLEQRSGEGSLRGNGKDATPTVHPSGLSSTAHDVQGGRRGGAKAGYRLRRRKGYADARWWPLTVLQPAANKSRMLGAGRDKGCRLGTWQCLVAAGVRGRLAENSPMCTKAVARAARAARSSGGMPVRRNPMRAAVAPAKRRARRVTAAIELSRWDERVSARTLEKHARCQTEKLPAPQLLRWGLAVGNWLQARAEGRTQCEDVLMQGVLKIDAVEGSQARQQPAFGCIDAALGCSC